MNSTRKVSRLFLVRDYFHKIRMFSRNARLFLLSAVLGGFGWGIWSVIFNLYLLDLGFREDFIGYIFLLGGLSGAPGFHSKTARSGYLAFGLMQWCSSFERTQESGGSIMWICIRVTFLLFLRILLIP